MATLFSDRSLLTMAHGVLLGGGALLALAAALFALRALGTLASDAPASPRQAREVGRLTALSAIVVWLSVLAGTFVVFPAYRAAPPPGAADLTAFPRALLLQNPDTAWLHAVAMEIKEHMPWIAAMLATAVAFVGVRYQGQLLADRTLRRAAMALLAVSLALVAVAALLGTLINKVAPLF
jgi:hypothetical protein